MQTLDTAVLCIRRLTSHGGATDDRVFGVEAFPGSLVPGTDVLHVEERPYEDVCIFTTTYSRLGETSA